MASGNWDDEEDSTPPSSPPQPAITRRSKFDDEEDDSDVVEDWDAAEDSEVEREKAKKAAEAKAKADAEAAANKKTKSQRIEERRMANMKKRMEEEDDESSSEDETTRRERLRKSEKDADLKHAEDLLSGIGISNKRGNASTVITDPKDPSRSFDLLSLPIFQPKTKDQFAQLREKLVPVFEANSSQPHYVLFMQEFTKQALKDLPSDQIKKIASGLTTLSNERMKEEKAAEKGGKKSKAAKTKTALVASRNVSAKADTNAYDDFDDDDFM